MYTINIGILTYHYVPNYGAVLQAYALKKQLEKLGHVVEIIDYRPYENEYLWSYSAFCKREKLKLKKSLYKKDLFLPFRFFKSLFTYLLFYFNSSNIICKYNYFSSFVYKYLSCDIKEKHQPEYLLTSLRKFDVVFLGSDQIWNPKITNGFDPFYFGCNFPPSVSKISYAASVGDLELVKQTSLQHQFFSLLSHLDLISVREKNLYDYLISNNISTSHVLDPTLLLEKKDYMRLLDNDIRTPERFLLVYELLYDPVLRHYAKRISKLLDLEMIIINGTFGGGTSALKNLGPCQFLSYLNKCTYVVTNSFHGLAFSLIFQKNFNIVLPSKRKDRLTFLLSLFDLSSRVISSDSQIDTTQINYDNINKIKQIVKQESLDFICSALAK